MTPIIMIFVDIFSLSRYLTKIEATNGSSTERIFIDFFLLSFNILCVQSEKCITLLEDLQSVLIPLWN